MRNAWAVFLLSLGPSPRRGVWVFERVWNGDQVDYGFNFTALPQVLRVRLGTY
jgi:hypothetical protein